MICECTVERGRNKSSIKTSKRLEKCPKCACKLYKRLKYTEIVSDSDGENQNTYHATCDICGKNYDIRSDEEDSADPDAGYGMSCIARNCHDYDVCLPCYNGNGDTDAPPKKKRRT